MLCFKTSSIPFHLQQLYTKSWPSFDGSALSSASPSFWVRWRLSINLQLVETGTRKSTIIIFCHRTVSLILVTPPRTLLAKKAFFKSVFYFCFSPKFKTIPHFVLGDSGYFIFKKILLLPAALLYKRLSLT